MPESPFGSLAPDVRAELRALGSVRRHRRGAYLVLEGDRSDHAFLVREGRLRVVHTATDGRDVLVAVRGPGELVGELNALAGSAAPRTASVVALDDVVVQSIAAADLLRFVERHPAVALSLLRQLADRLRQSTAQHTDSAGYDTVHRVARALADQASSGRPVDGGTVVAVGLSQADLAGLVAASPKSVSRALAILRERGLVVTERRAIVVRDVDGLRAFAP